MTTLLVRKVGWKPRAENTILGTRVPRIDGVEKASGFAKYAADINTPARSSSGCSPATAPRKNSEAERRSRLRRSPASNWCTSSRMSTRNCTGTAT